MKFDRTQTAFLGIDVAKKTFQAALKLGARYAQRGFSNNQGGFAQLRRWLERHADASQIHATLEATGVHHLELAVDLHGYLKSVSVVNPRCPKAFAQSQLRRSKSDPVDARILADFTEALKPKPWRAPSQQERELKELARRQKSLAGMVAAEKNRLQDARAASVRQSIQRHLEGLEEQKEQIVAELARIIHGDPILRQRLELLVSIPGIGEATALQLVAELGDVAFCYEKARDLAAHAGLTPRRRQSGTSVCSRGGICKIGSSRLRALLYFPAMVAMRHNPIMIRFAHRLRQNGKSGKAIVVAVMRKLLHCVFGVLKHQRPFNPHSPSSCST
ncbi:MAG: IS110 family transposase, partial [Verrucomicrobiae bacterium]|nr:IS110 family transposase [Verrucomicrobiae bacterium]MCP5542259.1 IS110 family transposase [Akkermansiaceae bacterium]